MNNLEKVKRQLAKPVEIVIKNSEGTEDTFMFKRFNIEQQAIMMELSKKFSSRNMIEIDGKEIPDVSKEDMKEMEELIFSVVKNSMPELEDEILREFTNDNFDQLSGKIIDLIPENTSEDKNKLIKQRIEASQDERGTDNKSTE